MPPDPGGISIIYYDLSDESAVLQITMLALGSEEQSGVLSDYGPRHLKTTVPAGQRIIFADMSSEKAAIRHRFPIFHAKSSSAVFTPSFAAVR